MEAVAAILNVDEDMLADQCFKNTLKCFNIDQWLNSYLRYVDVMKGISATSALFSNSYPLPIVVYIGNGYSKGSVPNIISKLFWWEMKYILVVYELNTKYTIVICLLIISSRVVKLLNNISMWNFKNIDKVKNKITSPIKIISWMILKIFYFKVIC